MPRIQIGPVRIADAEGTHEPDETVDNPTAALIELAQAGALHPETGLPYATLLADPAHTAPALAPAPAPTTEEVAP